MSGKHLRIGVDIGGTFTDVTVMDTRRRIGRVRKVAEHARRSRARHLRCDRGGRRSPARRRVHHSRLDRRDQRDPRTQGRADGARHDRRLSRRLRDRPHQPARLVQPRSSASTCRWFRATCVFEVRGAHALRRLGAGRRSTKRTRARCAGELRGAGRRVGRGAVPALVRQRRRTKQRMVEICCAKRCPARSSPPRTTCRANSANTSARRRSPPTPTSDRASARYLERLERPPRRRRLRRQPADHAVQRRPLRRRRPRACSASRCWNRARPAGVVASKTVGESLGLRQPDLLRHGRHDRQGLRAAGAAPPRSRADYFVGGYNEGLVIRIPVLDIKEVGTGGGSIAWIDEAGGLHVGPRKRRRRARARRATAAAATRRPSPTRTSCSAALAPDASSTAACRSMPRPRNARDRRRTSPRRSDSTLPPAAGGILAIANAAMANAVRAVTTERGLDPRDFALVAYGGAGPLHAVDVARELAIRTRDHPASARALLRLRHADGRPAARVRAHVSRAACTDGGLRGDRGVLRTTLEAEAAAWLRQPACRAKTSCSNTRSTCATSARITR